MEGINLENLTPFLTQYLIDMIRMDCEETGSVCPNWINQKKYNQLCEEDNKFGTHEAEKYYNSCHELVLSFQTCINQPNTLITKLKCRPLYPFNVESCNYENLEIQKKYSVYVNEFFDKEI